MADEPGKTRLRDGFLGWQCRVRQHAMRQYGGRPSPGMRPRVTRLDGAEIAPAMTVLLIEAEPEETTAMCRHIVKRTHDPERRYQDALDLLSAAHFQNAGHFSEVLTALVAAGAPISSSSSSSASAGVSPARSPRSTPTTRPTRRPIGTTTCSTRPYRPPSACSP